MNHILQAGTLYNSVIIERDFYGKGFKESSFLLFTLITISFCGLYLVMRCRLKPRARGIIGPLIKKFDTDPLFRKLHHKCTIESESCTENFLYSFE